MRRQAREVVHTALGMAILAYSAADAARRIILNTGKRVLRMTAPSSTPELDQVIDAGLDFAIRIKNMLSATSPGGKTVTLDELLDTVSDGNVRESIAQLWDVVSEIVRNPDADKFQLIGPVIEAIRDFLGTIRDALADRRVTLDELLHGVTDGEIRQSLKDAIEGLDKIGTELKGLDMWKLFGLVQKIAAKLPALLASA